MGEESEEISGNGILTIRKCKFTILQNGMVSYHVKKVFFYLSVLAYWSSQTLKVGSSAIDLGSIPGTSGRKGLEIANF